MKVYDIVKEILLSDKQARNSDKRLMFLVWNYQEVDIAHYTDWMDDAAHPKSIIEARRKLQRQQENLLAEGKHIADDELLLADAVVQQYREDINKEKGTHIFRDEVPVRGGKE